MDTRRAEEISGAARKIRLAVGRAKYSLWGSPPLDPIDRIDPVKLAQFLKIDLNVAEEIPPDSSEGRIGNLPLRAGSYLNRVSNQITVAGWLSQAAFRFTLTHAIAHWVLHPEEVRLPDVPRIAGDRDLSNPMTLDQEANIFTEEVLMPADLVKSYFRRILREGTLREREPDASLASWLSSKIGRTVTLDDLILRGRDYLAFLLPYGIPTGEPGLSLAQRFRVSPLAMSMRLQRLCLV